MIKRIMTTLLAAVTLLSMSTTAFAAENNSEQVVKDTSQATCYNMELTSDGVSSITDENGKSISPRSSISGYDDGTLSSNPAGIIIYPDASGIGGMGATVESHSSWNGYMNLDILGSDGLTKATGLSVKTNTTWTLDSVFSGGITHYSPSYILFSFRGIPQGQSVYVKIWVYG